MAGRATAAMEEQSSAVSIHQVCVPRLRSRHGNVPYPFRDRDALVAACGRICIHRKKINISTVMAGQRLGLKEVDDGI